MSPHFVKVYGSILDSTIWLEDPATKVVWITMLAMADDNGFVIASVPGLAKRAGVTRKECEAALELLLAPDPDSKTPDHEGRRLEKTDGGWLILNHRKYRDLRTDNQIATAERVRKHREKQRTGGVTVTDVTPGTAPKRIEVEGTEVTEATETSETAGSKATRFVSSVDPPSGAAATALTLVTRSEIVAPEPKSTALPPIVGRRTFEAVRDRLAGIVAEIAEGTRTRLNKEQLHIIMAETLFGYWCAKTGHEKSIFDDKREKLIVKQLRDNDGDMSELLYAIDGALRDDFLQGRSKDSTKKYDGIETIFRDRAIVERLAGAMKKHRDGVTHPLVEKYAAALQPEHTE